MATSITQAKPLLTASELELFDHSRAQPIKAFTAKQLAGKEKRARALRDKYRDLYRRQTLAQRGKAGKSAANADDANARTQRKAEILQEVLERFEARSGQLAAREERESPRTIGSKPVTSSPAAKQSASKKKPASKSPAKKVTAPPVASRNRSTVAKPTHKAKDSEHAISALAHLQDGEGGVHIDHLTGQDPTQRSTKAPSERAPTYGGKAQPPEVNAPLDMVASAARANPVRQMPGNIAIQGHQSSAVRRAQGKRDSR